jgi:hypothetical protein
VEALARREAMARLHHALDGLDEALRRPWRELASGKKLPQIAREQGVSYDRVKRQRRRLLAQLAGRPAAERMARLISLSQDGFFGFLWPTFCAAIE